MATIPSIAMIPSGYKANKVYSVLPTDGSGDLDSARTTTARRINSDSLIEEVAIGVPRLDYTDGSCPSLLIEGQSTNLITQSEAFGNSYWTKSGASIEPSSTRITGINLLDGYDFTTWNTYFSPTSVTSNSFTSDATKDGVSKDGVIVGSKSYELLITGNTTATSLNVRSNSGEDIKNLTGTFSETIRFQWVDSTDTDFTLSNVGVGTTTITSLQLYEVQGFSAPSVDSPLGAFKLIPSNASTIATSGLQENEVVTATKYSFTLFAKKGEYNEVILNARDNTSAANNTSAYFNLDTGIITNGVSAGTVTNLSANIVSLTNGWYKCSLSFSISLATTLRMRIYVGDSLSTIGDGTSGVYIFGAQLEEQSYATSYIPTAGTTISRTTDTSSKSGISSLINSSEGVFYMHISALANGGSDREISLSDGTSTNSISFYYNTIASKMSAKIRLNTVNYFFEATGINQTDLNKIAIRYSANDYSLWINGVNVAQNINGGAFPLNTLNSFSSDFALTNSNKFEGNCKDLRVYKTALSDAELLTLTSYSSFNEMALAQNYIIQ